MGNLDLGVIGNCTFGALINQVGRVVWACFPRFDGDPMFCSLLNDGGDGPGAPGGMEDGEDAGFFDIAVENFARSEQHYLHNTAILVTTLFDHDGGAVEIVDFAPRYKRLDRIFRPVMMVRQVRPVVGNPRVRVRLRPTHSYNAGRTPITRGSNHIRYVAPDMAIRCTTDAPVSYVVNEVPFLLEEPFTMLLGAGRKPDQFAIRDRSRILRADPRLLAGMVALPGHSL